KGRLPKDEARFDAAEVIDALEHIQNMGLIHRDIKPYNVLLTSDGHIKIVDFGSVNLMQDSQITVLPNAASDDKACTFVGTDAYVPLDVLNSSQFRLSLVFVVACGYLSILLAANKLTYLLFSMMTVK
nr:3-phosphoinositide-dependent protein kinase 1 [Tanacetum cinerariifolium]